MTDLCPNKDYEVIEHQRIGRGLELNDVVVFLEGYAEKGPPGWKQAAACFAHHIRQGAHRLAAAPIPTVDEIIPADDGSGFPAQDHLPSWCSTQSQAALGPTVGMSKWQPIETAPKDGGTEILVWGPGQYRKVVYWDDDNGNSAAFPWVDPQGDSYQATAFTCWQPLPPPPNVAKAAPSREDKARALVRDIIVNVFKQKADDLVISNVVAKVLKTFPKTDTGGEMRQYTESSSTQTVAAAPAANGAAPAPTFTVGLKTEAVAAPGPTAGNVERARQIVDRSTRHYSTEMMADEWEPGRAEIDRETAIREIADALSGERAPAFAELLAQVREPSEAIMTQMFKSQCHHSLCDFPDCIAKGYDRAGSASCWSNQYVRIKASLRTLADKLTEEK